MSENLTKNIKAIFYTDGSAGPSNPGWCGSGIHGYIYDPSIEKINKANRPPKTNITNIGYLQLTDLKDEFKLVQPVKYINGYISYSEIGTNNMAEVRAITKSIESICDLIESKSDSEFRKFLMLNRYVLDEIYIKTDSKYAIYVFEKVMTDIEADWSRKVDTNPILFVELGLVLKKAKELNIKITVNKVKGHSTSLGNHLSDRLALLGRIQSVRKVHNQDIHTEFHVTDATKYWNFDKENHPFLFGRELFFTNASRTNIEDQFYGVLNYKTDVEPGRKTNEAGFGVVVVDNKPDLIEDAINSYLQHLDTFSSISKLDLKELRSQPVMSLFNIFGKSIFMFNKKQVYLSCLEEQKLITQVIPAGLATNAFNKIQELYTIIKHYKTDKTETYNFIDITDKFFGLDEKNKPITLIPNGTNEKMLSIEFAGKLFNILIMLGIDTIGRNQFKKIEKNSPKVYIVFKKSTETNYHYYFLVHDTKNNDITCNTNFYTNTIFLK